MQALPRCKQRPMVNSISDEPARWKMLPVLKEHRPKVIALCISEGGMPNGVEDRVATASRLIDRLTSEGFALDDIYVDPCVMPLATGPHGKNLLAIGRPDCGEVSGSSHQRRRQQCFLWTAGSQTAERDLPSLADGPRTGCRHRRSSRPATDDEYHWRLKRCWGAMRTARTTCARIARENWEKRRRFIPDCSVGTGAHPFGLPHKRKSIRTRSAGTRSASSRESSVALWARQRSLRCTGNNSSPC